MNWARGKRSVPPERSRGTMPSGAEAFSTSLERVYRLRSTRAGWVLVIALLLSAPAFADSSLPPSHWANHQLSDPRQEARAQALMQELRCLVCQGQSIADSDADLAGDMRALVRERIAAGDEPRAIRAWLIERYGDWVSFKPPVEPLTWPLWAAPILLLAVGGWTVRDRLKR